MGGQQKYLQYVLSAEGNGLLDRAVAKMRLASKQNGWIKGLIEDRNTIGIRGGNKSKN